MSDLLHHLVEQYGLIAVLLGCIAEGESVAMLAGFLTHQGVFGPLPAFATMFFGAFLGDFGLFLAGRHFTDHPRIQRLKARPGFARAAALIDRHPNLYVLFNRYIYGFRAVGGIAAGLSAISATRFAVLNVISSALWALLFGALGFFLGAGAEQVLGRALLHHERLVFGLGAALLIALAAGYYAHRRVKAAQHMS